VCNFKTALEAVLVINSNETIWTHSMAATPGILFEALAIHAKKSNLTLLQLHTEGSEALSYSSLDGHLRHRCYFCSATICSFLALGMRIMCLFSYLKCQSCSVMVSKKLI